MPTAEEKLSDLKEELKLKIDSTEKFDGDSENDEAEDSESPDGELF